MGLVNKVNVLVVRSREWISPLVKMHRISAPRPEMMRTTSRCATLRGDGEEDAGNAISTAVRTGVALSIAFEIVDVQKVPTATLG